MNRLIVIILVVLLIGCNNKEKIKEVNIPTIEMPLYVFNSGKTEIEKNDWEPSNFIHSDSSSYVLRIDLKEKYDGYYHIYCKALFSNQKTRQFKLIAPWIEDIVIDWSLTTSKTAVKIHKDSLDREDIKSYLK